MDPPSGNSQQKNSSTDLPQSNENDAERTDPTQSPDNRQTAVDSGADGATDKLEDCLTSLCQLEDVIEECQKQIEDQTLIEQMNTKEEEREKDELSKTIEQLSIIFAYPSKQRPRQPFMIPPAGQSGSNQRPAAPPRPLPAAPSYYHPAASQQPQPQHSNQPQNSQEQTPPTTEQPRSGDAGPHRPRKIPIFIDPYMYYGGPGFFLPSVINSAVTWAPLPPKIPANIPSCLAHLSANDCFYIAQINLFDLFFDHDEFYIVQNRNGECLYFVYETTDYGEFALCESYRAYRLHVMDMYSNEVMLMNKLSGCTSCCCCYPEMLVYAPPGTNVGAVTKKFNMTREEYRLLDSDRNYVFRMLGPCCATCCCWTLEADFTIHALDEEATEVGFIRREIGFLASYNTSEFFGLTLPMDMDVRIKAVFLGAVFLTVR